MTLNLAHTIPTDDPLLLTNDELDAVATHIATQDDSYFPGRWQHVRLAERLRLPYAVAERERIDLSKEQAA